MCEGNRKLVGFYSGYQDSVPGEPQRLGESLKAEIECDFVMLSVWAIASGTADTLKPAIAAASVSAGDDIQSVAGEEIYWGFENVCVHPLYPPNSTDLIPVNQLGDIYVRANASAAAIRVGYSLFRYKKEHADK